MSLSSQDGARWAGSFRASESIRLDGAAFGLMPTHARIVGDELRVARRAADLVDGPGVLDVDRLCALFVHAAPIPAHASIFEGVIRAPPDAVTTVHRDGRVEVAMQSRALSESPVSPVDVADEIWRRIVASVKRAVSGSKRVFVATGGGLDSSALLVAAVAICRGANQKEVGAVALHFAGEGDDRPYLRHLERELGIEAVKVAPCEAGPALLSLLESSAMPGWSASQATDFAFIRAARDHGADVVLSGFGGDDVLDGFPRMLADDFASGRMGALLDVARLRPTSSSTPRRLGRLIVRPLVARAVPRGVLARRRINSLCRQRPWMGPTLRKSVTQHGEQWTPPAYDSPNARFAAIAQGALLVDCVELADELAARVGVRLVHPYLDVPIVELMSQIPPRLLLHANRLRGLFRLAIRGRVPPPVRLRLTKASFSSALREALNAAGGFAVLRDLASMKESEKLGLVDPSTFRSAFDGLEHDDESWPYVWTALGIEGFLRARAKLA